MSENVDATLLRLRSRIIVRVALGPFVLAFPCVAVIVALRDLAWTPDEPYQWTDPEGITWKLDWAYHDCMFPGPSENYSSGSVFICRLYG